MKNGEVITDHWEDCKDSCFDREESGKENGGQGLYSLKGTLVQITTHNPMLILVCYRNRSLPDE